MAVKSFASDLLCLLYVQWKIGDSRGGRMLEGMYRRVAYGLLVVLMLTFGGTSTARAQLSADGTGQSAFSIPQSQLIQTDILDSMLQKQPKARPVIFQVGSHLMYSQAHIPGSIYAGPGSQASGLTLLASKVKTLQKSQLIILYCGCCPWSHCPNIGPAFKRLHDLGFTNVKALYLANNFGDDWVGKGYRVEQGN